MRIGTRGTTPHRLRRLKQAFVMTRATIQKIPENHAMLPKEKIIISIEVYVK
jgi:hypothetical protein